MGNLYNGVTKSSLLAVRNHAVDADAEASKVKALAQAHKIPGQAEWADKKNGADVKGHAVLRFPSTPVRMKTYNPQKIKYSCESIFKSSHSILRLKPEFAPNVQLYVAQSLNKHSSSSLLLNLSLRNVVVNLSFITQTCLKDPQLIHSRFERHFKVLSN